ncbi:MAG: isopenicillin N synthase family oxygenase [Candidatus Latescibacteria bacterium]|nr:isopenicillin N synthase family oxygenase [Candidatus Latescibacterota bacterium]
MPASDREDQRPLPEIDIGAFLTDEGTVGAQECVEKLRGACHGPGFCYLVNHGIDGDLEAQVLNTTRRFFDLPESDRLAIRNTKSAQFRGYTRLGMERTNNVRDWRDQIDFGPERDVVPVGPDDPLWLRLHGPNQWPPALPDMQDGMLLWMDQMSKLGTRVLRALALGLGQQKNYFDYLTGQDPEFLLKVIRYPHVPGESGQGVGLHQDSGLLTFILQDGVSGLEVGIGNDTVKVEPRSGSMIMNLGEMLQIATGGYLRATKHRVVMPPEGSERISLAYFVNPALEASVVPVPLPIELALDAVGGENTDPDDPVFSVYGANKLKFRARSHPDVAAIHYPELVDLNGQGIER